MNKSSPNVECKNCQNIVVKNTHKETSTYLHPIQNFDRIYEILGCQIEYCAQLELYDQAIKALKKATEAKPEQLTAWQGISSHYEKKKDMKKEDLEDLAVAYAKILKILEASDDMKKYYLISEKLVTLHYEKLGHFHNAIKVIQDRIQVRNIQIH